MRKGRLVSLGDKNFINNAILKGIRIDGRVPLEARDLEIRIGNNSAEVSLGDTKAFAVVTMEVVAPIPTRPTEGIFTFNAEFSPMANPEFVPGRPSPRAIEISRVVERAIKRSRALDVESLCIIAGSQVWSVRVDVHILDDCGNLTDCVSIATIAALCASRHNAVTIEGTEAFIHSVSEKETVPLSVHHVPISVSFGFMNNGTIAIIDPTAREEQVIEGSISIAVNKFQEVCGIQKAGGIGIDVDLLFKLINIASQRAVRVTELIAKAIENSREKEKRFGSVSKPDNHK